MTAFAQHSMNDGKQNRLTTAAQEWRELLTERLGLAEAKGLCRRVYSQGASLIFAECLFDADACVARNAGWVLTQAAEEERLSLQPLQNRIVDLILATPSSAVRRLSLNLILSLPMEEDDLRTDFLDFCLNGMRSLEEPPGIQALCMKMAGRMCSFYPELMAEFRRTLELMEVEQYTPGVKHLWKKIMQEK